jgi:hypothetical protein
MRTHAWPDKATREMVVVASLCLPRRSLAKVGGGAPVGADSRRQSARLYQYGARQRPTRRQEFAMRHEVNLSGGEIALLKSMGLSGAPVFGKLLIQRVGDMETAEFLDTLEGLVSLGYVVSDKVSLRKMEDVERAVFRVNASYVRELRDAIRPGHRREQERRRRRG